MIVWLASYPRSGNTFLRLVLNHCFDIKTFSIYNDLGDISADEPTKEIVGHEFLSEDFNVETARRSDLKYYIKTHGFWTPDIEQDKFIYMIRDGREATVSFSAYLEQYSKDASDYINIIGGDTFVGYWGKHVESWAPLKRTNCLLIKFEELVTSTKDYLPVISDFIEKEIISDIIPSFEKLKTINPKFFKSGKKNSWKSKLSEEEQLYFWYKNYYNMINYGYKDEIPSLIKHKNFIEFSSIFKNEFDIQLIKTKKIIVEQLNIYNQMIQEKDKSIKEKDQEIQTMENRILQIEKSFSYNLSKFISWPLRKLYRIKNEYLKK